ncbi:DUF4124 domain-containing protein [Aquabacterium sp.]|jgi:hypothetical protein|uniref:DUF4124 domain-containing protein n=1 Tax=Aquabacterium sp. TaxID=1872578 RepID=UPI0025BDD19E|nr:DUF4124 domain-containing protein [Aquabacterium sp.]
MKNLRLFPARCALFLLAGTVVWSAPVMAGMQWKWRDAGGNIQYSDRPPPAGTPDSAILSKPSVSRSTPRPAEVAASAASAAVVASTPAKQPESDLDVKRRKAEEERLAKQKADEEKQAKTRADNCTRARGYLKTLNDGIRIARTNAAGEREVLDDKGRAEETQRTQEMVQANCK